MIASSVIRKQILLLCTLYSFFAGTAQSVKATGAVKPFNGRPTVFINDTPVYPMIYTLTDVPGGRNTWEEMPQHNIERMAEAGVKIFCFSIFFDQMWSAEDGDLDISLAQKMIKGITDVSKDASVIIRLHVHPPQWWYKKYPGECVQYADAKPVAYDDSSRFKRIQHNDPATVIRYSLASTKWKETMGKKVMEFCEKLSKTNEGNSVIGMQVAGGIYGEWHYWGFIQNYPDVSEPMNTYFRQWLKNKYTSEDALEKAWNKKDVTFKTAAVPGFREREDKHNELFLDQETQRNLIDYNECQDELVADDIIYFAKAVKESWGRPIITGTFYGYFFPVFMRETVGGHLSVQKVLQSPYVDYLSGPQCYFPNAEKIGDPARSRGLVTSCFLNGKLWLDEYDTQPDLSAITYIGADKNTPKYDSIVNNALALVRRNMSVSAARGQGFWFFDFGVAGGREYQEAKDNGSNGWWDFPFILEDISKAKKVFEKQMLKPYESQSDVLMIYDTKIFYELTTDKDLLSPVYVTDYWISDAVWKAGVAADYINIDDLDKVNIDQYKVVVFNNTYNLTPQQRSLVKNKVLKNNRDVIWFYAPGYSDGQTRSVKNMEDITGFKLQQFIPDKPYSVSINASDFKYTYGIGDKILNPLFYVSDEKARSTGVYTGSDKTALAKKSFPGYTSWYVGLPEYGTGLMKFLLKSTPAHFYGTGDEIFYVGNGMVIMHTAEKGMHKVFLKNNKVIEYNVPEGGATIVFDSNSGKVLL